MDVLYCAGVKETATLKNFNFSSFLSSQVNSNIMLSTKILAIFLMAAGACSTFVVRNSYEETLSYLRNPQCKPSKLDKGIQCSAVGPSIEVAGGIVSIQFLFNNPNYYVTYLFIHF